MKKRVIIIAAIALLVIARYTIFDDKEQERVLPSLTENQEENAIPSLDEAVVGIKVGNIAPNFTLKDIEGIERSLEDYRGKDVILYFWVST